MDWCELNLAYATFGDMYGGARVDAVLAAEPLSRRLHLNIMQSSAEPVRHAPAAAPSSI